MSKEFKIIRPPKPRNHTTMNMILHTKPGPMTDKKKEKNKTVCRDKTVRLIE